MRGNILVTLSIIYTFLLIHQVIPQGVSTGGVTASLSISSQSAATSFITTGTTTTCLPICRIWECAANVTTTTTTTTGSTTTTTSTIPTTSSTTTSSTTTTTTDSTTTTTETSTSSTTTTTTETSTSSSSTTTSTSTTMSSSESTTSSSTSTTGTTSTVTTATDLTTTTSGITTTTTSDTTTTSHTTSSSSSTSTTETTTTTSETTTSSTSTTTTDSTTTTTEMTTSETSTTTSETTTSSSSTTTTETTTTETTTSSTSTTTSSITTTTTETTTSSASTTTSETTSSTSTTTTETTTSSASTTTSETTTSSTSTTTTESTTSSTSTTTTETTTSSASTTTTETTTSSTSTTTTTSVTTSTDSTTTTNDTTTPSTVTMFTNGTTTRTTELTITFTTSTTTHTSTSSTSTSSTSTSTTSTTTETSTSSTSTSSTTTDSSSTSTSTTSTTTDTSTSSTFTTSTSSASTSSTTSTSSSTTTTFLSTTITTTSTSTISTTMTTICMPVCLLWDCWVPTTTTSTSSAMSPIDIIPIIRSNQSNATQVAEALQLYFNQTVPSVLLTPDDIDHAISRLNISVNSTVQNGFIMSQIPTANENSTTVGAIFLTLGNGKIIVEQARVRDVNTNISAGGIYTLKSLNGINYVRIILIDSPNEYRNVTDTQNRTLASSVVVANLQSNTAQITSNVNISLYFRVKKDLVSEPIDNVEFYCSFYHSTTKNWNDSGCSRPIYNAIWDRHECYCTHLTSFALIWLPKTSETGELDAQDIASLVFQSVSIICFLITIIHAIYIRIVTPKMSSRAKDCLPLVSYAVTMILFIFYIALGMTVYKSSETKNTEVCFLSSSILMFFVYFFLILMFCIKTSVAYFNFINFFRLFPPPSYRKLYIALTISFIVSIIYVAFAAGFNSNSSLTITALYVKKICWFTRRVVHYFVTIPICICVLLNIIMLIFVAKRLFEHLRISTTRHDTYNRIKRCVLILIASCITQGIGWLLGPFLSFADQKTANILGWFFVICNGLEGFWAVIFYKLLRDMRIDEQIRHLPAEELPKRKKSERKTLKNKKPYEKQAISSNKPAPTSRRDTQRTPRSFDNLYEERDHFF